MLFASGEGEEATDGIEVACGAGHTEVALQSIVGETGILIGLWGVYVRAALGEMKGSLFSPSLLGERLQTMVCWVLHGHGEKDTTGIEVICEGKRVDPCLKLFGVEYKCRKVRTDTLLDEVMDALAK